jgi:hypothetical protein
MPHDDDWDDYLDPGAGRPTKQVSVLGLISLVTGIGSLALSFVPTVGPVAVLPGALGLALGGLGLVLARKSHGRQGSGLPVAGLSTSTTAVLVALVWWGIGSRSASFRAALPVPSGPANRDDPGARAAAAYREINEINARAIAEEARRKAEQEVAWEAEQAKAAADVRKAGNAIRVTATQLAREYEADEAEADRKYKGKVLEVTGRVAEIPVAPAGNVDVQGPFPPDGDRRLLPVTGFDNGKPVGWVGCYFAKDPTMNSRLGRLKTGDQVTVRGMCNWRQGLSGCLLVE